ncbi:diguanylate cyclase domain-containing protein [Comamonas sp. GB3 AK4-5]|uniref:GGDEF domain-containing protein n=1 Tax=Comamonas sp. GB3 AK4-5 TaxID=3231487 RepID=UPI00351E2D8E
MTPPPRRAVDAAFLPRGLYRPTTNACLLGLGVWLLCLLGIYSRPLGDLALFWPANAFLLGMLVRYPHFAHRSSWLAAALGYVLADAMASSPLEQSLLINAGNLVSVAVGYLVFRQITPSMHRLQTPASVLYILLALLCTAFTAGLFGMYAGPDLLGDSPLRGFAMWCGTELATGVAVLPMLLALPEWRRPHRQCLQLRPARLLPAFTLLLSVGLGIAVGGPGAIAFPVPALMWCAVSYNLFSTTVLSFGVSVWSLVGLAMALQTGTPEMVDRELLLSVRLGLALMMLAPIMVASVMVTNRALAQRLRLLADQDPLTQLPNRRAFLEAARQTMPSLRKQQASCAVLMMDIDHFKSVNDGYGHATGDAVLAQFGQLLRAHLREQDLLGRMGGEEFAILLPHTGAQEAATAAQRLRGQFAALHIPVPGHAVPLRCTVSIGLAVDPHSSTALDELLAQADRALYRAKRQGRNVVQLFTPSGLKVLPPP